MTGFAIVTQVGEGFAGTGVNVAHVNTVLGRKGGPGRSCLGDSDELLLIAALWVSWDAHDEEEVFRNNHRATHAALDAGARLLPDVAELLAAADSPANPYFRR